MRYYLLPAFLVAPTFGQIPVGDFLVCNTDAIPNTLAHVTRDGSTAEVVTATPGTIWSSAALAPDGRWFAARSAPQPGLAIYDPFLGSLQELDTPGTGLPRDLEVAHDGTLVVVYLHEGKVRGFDSSGGQTFVTDLTSPAVVDLDHQGQVWVYDQVPATLVQMDTQGTILATVPLAHGPAATEVARDVDGTFWILELEYIGPTKVHHFAADGASLGWIEVDTALSAGLDISPDGELWFSRPGALLRYDRQGALLEVLRGGGFHLSRARHGSAPLGTAYCGPANPNSSGLPAELTATGQERVLLEDVVLRAAGLPAQQSAYFLVSSLQGFVPFAGGSQGNLCLDGPIGRYTKQLLDTGSGTLEFVVDLTQLPQPGGAIAVAPGETWNWQLWFQDQNPGPTSNFSDGLSVTFQ